jgi:DNA-directed RNA polymerase specialized sigma24 family protein
VELVVEPPSDDASPLESAIREEVYERYRAAVDKLRPRDREMVVARVEVQWSFQEIAHRFDLPSVDAARMAVTRSLKRLVAQVQTQASI